MWKPLQTLIFNAYQKLKTSFSAHVGLSRRLLMLVIAVICGSILFQNCSVGKFEVKSSEELLPNVDCIPNGTGICVGGPLTDETPSDSCQFNGAILANNGNVTAFQNSSVAFGQNCQSQSRKCSSGVLSGSYAFATCAVGVPASCLFNGLTIGHGSVVSAYQNSSVASGETCKDESRVCNNGVLSGSFSYANCSVGAPVSCLFNGQTIAHGRSVSAYPASTVSFGKPCVSEMRMCNNGTLSGSATYGSCEVSAGASCLFRGQTLANGQNTMAYQASYVAYGQTCVPQTRTCMNGTLSGTYEFPSCMVSPAPDANKLVENAAATVWPDNAIEGIHAGEIFQRKDDGKAQIQIVLKKTVPAGMVFYSVALLTLSGSKEVFLDSGVLDSKTGFNFSLATGMASRKVRFSLYDANGLEQIRWISPGFSVGEVFLVSGQSNSTTHGLGATTSKSILNRGVDPLAKAWVPMVDPLPYGSNYAMAPWNNPNFSSGSPWPSFADDLSNQLHVPVAIILVGWGGSSVAMWLPGAAEDYFPRLIVGAKSVPACGFRAVLWHQGESDSMGKTSAGAYLSNLQTVMSRFRNSTGCSQPWMIARATYLHSKYWMENYKLVLETDADVVKWPAEVEIRKAQNAVGKMPGGLLGPDTDLVIAHKYRNDDLHFSAEGLALHGKLWSQRVLGLLGYPALYEKDLVPEVKTIWTSMQTILTRTDAEMEEDAEGVRYWTGVYSGGKISLGEIEKVFRESDEAFIRKVYKDDIGRRPTSAEVGDWVSKMANKTYTNRDQLKAAILKTK